MGAGYEVEPNLVGSAPAGRLWGPDDPRHAEADAVTLEQRRLAVLLQAIREDRAELADKIIRGLVAQEVWQPFGATQGDGAVLKRIVEIERGGTWKVAGILAVGDAGNTADVLVTLTDLVPGYALRATAKRTDPAELGLNAPLRSLDGSFTLAVTGGVPADKVLVYVRLQRTGSQIGGN